MASICEECSCWKRCANAETVDIGECRRHAPRLTIGHSAAVDLGEALASPTDVRVWPLTFCDDWCGEFCQRRGQTIEVAD